jgi:methionyl-tRNA formyltransferase
VSSSSALPSFRRIVFFGTPEFAVPSLRALVRAGRAPLLVVAQPARPAGRGKALREPPVAVTARELGLPVEQPVRVRRPEFVERLRALEPDLAVVVAFGQIFPQALLDVPRFGCLNVHASLLPRHRGAAPIQAAILAGDERTGVTTMRMTAGMDEGPMLLDASLAIGPRETAAELSVRLAELGAELLLATLEALERGEIADRRQDDSGATYAGKVEKSAARIDWRESASRLALRLRAQTPWPGLETGFRGEVLKVLELEADESGPPGEPGTVLAIGGDGICVASGDGSVVWLRRVQRPGGRPVAAAEFARATPDLVGAVFRSAASQAIEP